MTRFDGNSNFVTQCVAIYFFTSLRHGFSGEPELHSQVSGSHVIGVFTESNITFGKGVPQHALCCRC